jgi:anti-sigma factor (TIGR02949 family)
MSLSSTDWSNNSENQPINYASPCEKKKSDCLKVIQTILDGEASEEQRKHFETHIEDCLSCFDQFNLDKTIKLALQTKICKMDVPVDLLQLIRVKIDEIA